MVFTPNPNLFTDAASGGIRVGASLAELMQRRQDRKRLGQLAQLFQQGDYNGVGAGLIEMGQVSPGVSVANIPYEREQQALQREFQNAQFMDSRDFRRQQFDATQKQQALQNSMQAERMDMERRRFEAEMDPNNPLNALNENWTTPTQAVGPDGQPVFIQTSNRGGVRQVEGFAPSNPIKTIDTGTEIVTVDSRTNAILSRTQKQNSESERQKAFGKEIGKSEGEGLASSEADFNAAEDALTIIASIRNDPNRELGTGASSIFNRIPFTGGYDFQSKVDQATSGAFLTAIQSLRGMGALSNAEGQTATRAVTRLTTASSEKAFMEALQDYEDIVLRGRNRAAEKMQKLQRMKAGSQLPTVTPADQPENSDLVDQLIRKYGG